MEVEIKNYRGYEYIIYEFSRVIDSAILDEVMQRAKEDYPNMNKKAPSGIDRDKSLIYWNCLGGALAEKTIKLHLQRLIDQHRLNARILPSPFTTHPEHRDIKVEVNGRVKTIEVRSSFNYLANLEGVLTGKFSLLGKYTTSFKSEESDKDFYITVIHRYRNEQILFKFSSSVETFIIGGASREVFNRVGIKNDPKLKQEDANYLTIRPIISAPNIQLVFNEILDIPEQQNGQPNLLEF